MIGAYVFYVGVMIAVVPFGASHLLTQSVAAGVFALAVLISLFAPPGHPSVDRATNQITALLAALVGWIWVQTVDAPWMPTVPYLSEIPADVRPRLQTISVDPVQTRASLLTLLEPGLAGLAALRLFRDDRAALRLLQVLGTFGAVVVALSLVEYLVAPGRLLNLERWAYRGIFTATFVNRNSAATFVGLAIIVNACLLLRLFLRQPDLTARHILERILGAGAAIDADTKAIVRLVAILALLALALVSTQSRAGILATLLGVMLVAALAARFARLGETRHRPWPWIAAGVAVLFLAVFGGQVLARFDDVGLDDEGRLCVYRGTIAAIRDNFWLGTGFGTFEQVYPLYRDPLCSGLHSVWDRAHNAYLEFILGIGVVAVPVMAGILGLLVSRYWSGLRRRHVGRFAPICGLGSLALLAVHSLVDFSLQIPGVAVYAAAILAACIVTSSCDAHAPTHHGPDATGHDATRRHHH